MNKKLLFGIMSLAALAACTNDDFESQGTVAEQTSPIQFEVINGNEAMRASMNGNSIAWSAADGDLFTLYHGGALGGAPSPLTGYENATYKASEGEGGAVLTTPSMIKPGRAIMVWPADTTFYTSASGNLTVKIPATLENVENNIPYASDLLTIAPYAAYTETAPATAYNTAGKDRKYAVYMRPMASQLILKADYAGTDAAINALATGDDPIDPIALTSVDIKDPTNTSLTQEIDLSFDVPGAGQGGNWATVTNNAWTEVTAFDLTSAVGVAQLTTKCINGLESAKFLILPQANIGAGGLGGAEIVVNTSYGKVTISAAGGYTAAELADAWYRYAAAGAGAGTYAEVETTTAGTGSDASKVKYTNNIEKGLAQVIDAFSGNNTTKATSVVVGEPTGAVGTRYVKVLLTHIDMNDLHITSDKQLYDAVRVWKEIGSGNVTVRLDGDATTGEFEISQKTIAKINEINAAVTGRKFNVTACDGAGEVCNTIVITGGGAVKNMDFIVNTVAAADVVLKAGETWNWSATTVASKKAVIVDATATGVKSIINKGTLVSDATATLAVYDNAAVPAQVANIPFVNDGTWNVSGGVLNVQFDVTNNGKVYIASGAEYRQDGAGNDFTNEATTLPKRITGAAEQIGFVENKGVFACVNTGNINNYGLIEHAAADAMTFITANQSATADFANNFAGGNKMGRINLPWDNKGEDNVTINNAAATGFVSVTVDGEVSTLGTGAGVLGNYVNYIIIKSGVTQIQALDPQYEYVEIADEDNTQIAWSTGSTSNYSGLIVLSPVNITYGTTVSATVTYLGANMYVAGTFNKALTDWNGYYGDTSGNVATKYITFN